jgi:hypothetical protein
VRLRATDPLNAFCEREPVVPRPVPRQKRNVGTSHCAGASISYAVRPQEPGCYRFDRECFCLSPQAHGAQFFDAVPLPWVKGNA